MATGERPVVARSEAVRPPLTVVVRVRAPQDCGGVWLHLTVTNAWCHGAARGIRADLVYSCPATRDGACVGLRGCPVRATEAMRLLSQRLVRGVWSGSKATDENKQQKCPWSPCCGRVCPFALFRWHTLYSCISSDLQRYRSFN